MFSAFETYIQQHAQLTNADIKLMRQSAVEKSLRRKELLVRQGEVCRYKIFVAKGMLRSYASRHDGSEHIMQFSPENHWCTEPESMEKGTPSAFNIEALEPSGVVYWTRNDLHYLIANIPGLKVYFDKLIYRAGGVMRQRILSGISLTAEEKYEEFINKFPDIHARVPLHMVASYLGVTRETLSRIRHGQLVKSK